MQLKSGPVQKLRSALRHDQHRRDLPPKHRKEGHHALSRALLRLFGSLGHRRHENLLQNRGRDFAPDRMALRARVEWILEGEAGRGPPLRTEKRGGRIGERKAIIAPAEIGEEFVRFLGLGPEGPMRTAGFDAEENEACRPLADGDKPDKVAPALEDPPGGLAGSQMMAPEYQTIALVLYLNATRSANKYTQLLLDHQA